MLAIAVIVLVYATRLDAAWYRTPFSGHPDENYIVNPAFQTAKTGELNPHFLNYGSFNSYLLATLYSTVDAVNRRLGGSGFLGEEPTPDHYVLARLMVMLLSGLTVVVTAELGHRLVNPVVGVLSGAFLVAAPLHAKYSYIASVNPAVALWSVASCLVAVLLLDRRRRSLHVLGGICAGLTIGSKYIGATAMAPLLLAHLLGRTSGERRSARDLGWWVAATALAFVVSTPYAVLRPEFFMRTLADVRLLQDSEQYPLHYSSSGSSYAEYARAMLRSGYLLGPMLAAACGSLWLASRDWKRTLVLVSHPLLLLLLVGSYRTFWLRNLLSVLPFLAVLSGIGVYGLASAVLAHMGGDRRALAVRWGAGLLLFAAISASSMERTRNLLQAASPPDTRSGALAWVQEHAPPGTRIVREQRTPELEAYCDGLDVRAVRSIARPDRRSEFARDYDYALISYAFAPSVRRAPEYAAERERYAEFFERHALVAEFLGDREHFTGATIRIYRMSR